MKRALEILDIVKWFLIGAFWVEFTFENRGSRGAIIVTIFILFIIVLVAIKIIKKNLGLSE